MLPNACVCLKLPDALVKLRLVALRIKHGQHFHIASLAAQRRAVRFPKLERLPVLLQIHKEAQIGFQDLPVQTGQIPAVGLPHEIAVPFFVNGFFADREKAAVQKPFQLAQHLLEKFFVVRVRLMRFQRLRPLLLAGGVDLHFRRGYIMGGLGVLVCLGSQQFPIIAVNVLAQLVQQQRPLLEVVADRHRVFHRHYVQLSFHIHQLGVLGNGQTLHQRIAVIVLFQKRFLNPLGRKVKHKAQPRQKQEKQHQPDGFFPLCAIPRIGNRSHQVGQ